jgi:hypothetical protein
MARAAFLVADAIEGMHHVLGKLCTLTQDRLEHVRARIGKPGQVGIALVAEHFVQDEERIPDRRLVGRHGRASSINLART